MCVRPNEWYKLEVIAEGERLRLMVDDRTTVDCRAKNPALAEGCTELVCWAGGKFTVRNIEIKELPAK